MKKMNYSLLIVLISLITLMSGCKEKPGWEITIRGKVGFPQEGGQITIQEIKSGDVEAAKEVIELKSDYTYEKKLRLIEPGFYRLSFFDRQFVTVILNKSDVEVNADGNNMNGFAEIKGSPDHDIITKVQSILINMEKLPEVEMLQREFSIASANQDAEKVLELQNEYLKVIGRSHDLIATYIQDQPASLAVISLLQQGVLDRDKYYSVYVSAAEKLKKEWPDFQLSKDFILMVDAMKTTSIGQIAPEIELPDTEGQPVKLSSLRGKYVLVDFWAKWCGPCRRENPNVVKAYQKYKGKGFEVFGVSLDRTKEDWLQAIQEDQLTWTHVSDLKYFESQAAKDYNISAIPFSILLDPEGKIIAKNLRGGALDKKLEEVLGGI